MLSNGFELVYSSFLLCIYYIFYKVLKIESVKKNRKKKWFLVIWSNRIKLKFNQ